MVAKDIMTKDVITVSPTTTVKNLAKVLIQNRIKSAARPSRIKKAKSWVSSLRPTSLPRRENR